MNKKLFILLLCMLFAYFCLQLPKYRFGYYKKGPTFDICKIYYEFVALNDGNILFLASHLDDADVYTDEEISYLYNIETGELAEYDMPKNIYYGNSGILLPNNKFLLTYVYDQKLKTKPPVFPLNMGGMVVPAGYNSMAVVDLTTKKVEKVIRKKINNKFKPEYDFTTFTLLDNGKVLIIDFYNQVAEIYNPSTNTTKLLDVKIDKYPGGRVVATKNGKALIFGQTRLTENESSMIKNYIKNNSLVQTDFLSKDTVYEYDDATESIKVVGSVLLRERQGLVKVNEDKLLIYGGNAELPWYASVDIREIELYDIPSNTSKIIGVSRKGRRVEHCRLSSTAIPINERYILLAGGYEGTYGVLTFPARMSEIIDLKKERVYIGPNLPLKPEWPLSFKLNNGKILILNDVDGASCKSETRFFEPMKGLKNE